jgi:hypothetical protein
MAFRRIVRQRQAAWIEDAGVRPKGFEETAPLRASKNGCRSGPQRAIKQQHAGTAAKLGELQPLGTRLFECGRRDIGYRERVNQALTFCLKDQVRDAGLDLGLGWIDPQNIAAPEAAQSRHRKGLYRSIVR